MYIFFYSDGTKQCDMYAFHIAPDRPLSNKNTDKNDEKCVRFPGTF